MNLESLDKIHLPFISWLLGKKNQKQNTLLHSSQVLKTMAGPSSVLHLLGLLAPKIFLAPAMLLHLFPIKLYSSVTCQAYASLWGASERA